MSVLLTGATGFVGGEVLARIAGDEEVLALVRGRAPDRPGARPVLGDLTAPGLGVAPGALDGVTEIVHCAASVSWGLPIHEARAVNVEGTRRVLEVASGLRGLRRFVYVSTAYVAGRFEGRFGEDDLFVGQEFRNTYEQSKAEAEQLVHDAGLPSVIVRPSIVMGDSKSGFTPVFNVLYWPLRAYSRGLLREIPASPQARVDIVPVDYVADAIVAALRSNVGGSLNAVAGDGAVTVDVLAELAADALGRERPRLAAFDTALAEQSPETAAYFEYFDMKVVFDAARGRAVFGAPPLLEDYFPTLMAYAQEARWGKRAPPPEKVGTWTTSARRAGTPSGPRATPSPRPTPARSATSASRR
jgi:long-chain acyl-CoA synthetase